MSQVRKIPISDDLLNQFVKIMLDVDNIKNIEGKVFSLESLKQNMAVKNYLDAHIGEQLRKCFVLDRCDKIRQQHEATLQEKDLITIFRATLKKRGFKLIGVTDATHVSKPRAYYISQHMPSPL